MVGNKSVYNENELKEKYDTWASLTLIELFAPVYFLYTKTGSPTLKARL